jgi:hypothetical protein
MTPFWDDEVARWVAAKLGEDGFGRCVSMGVLHDYELVAGVVYHQWSPECGTIQMSAASDDALWLTRPVLWEMFSYPFDRAHCQLAALRVGEKNRTANGRGIQRTLKAYGFEAYRIPRLRGRDEAEIVFTLTDDAWRANGFHKEHR